MPSHNVEAPNAEKASRATENRNVVCDFPAAFPVTDEEIELLLRVLGEDLVQLLDDGKGDWFVGKGGHAKPRDVPSSVPEWWAGEGQDGHWTLTVAAPPKPERAPRRSSARLRKTG